MLNLKKALREGIKHVAPLGATIDLERDHFFAVRHAAGIISSSFTPAEIKEWDLWESTVEPGVVHVGDLAYNEEVVCGALIKSSMGEDFEKLINIIADDIYFSIIPTELYREEY